MLAWLMRLFRSKRETAQHQAIHLLSVKQAYLERRDIERFRELVDFPENIELSLTQVIAATSHAQETLVVAGAGSGKTSVLVGRAKYLVESGRAKEEEILMLAYNKAAAEELSDRTKISNINVSAQTFHGFGNSIIKSEGERTGVAFGGNGEVASFLRKQLDDVLDEKALQSLSIYFSEQLVPKRPYEDFRNLSEYRAYVQATILKTLMDEKVKSHGEWLIANFLFTHNLEYKYEALYDVSGNPKERHVPDFTVFLPDDRCIYIEYFGIDRQGNTAPGIGRDVYLEGIEWKKSIHATNGTECISLYYYDLMEGNLLGKLGNALDSLNVTLDSRNYKDVLNQANKLGYHSRFLKICDQFLIHVRAQRLSGSDLLALARNDKRSLAFLSVFNIFLENYEMELKKRKLPDFSELINGAADSILRGEYEFKFTHLLVDEFQDISKDRFRLIEAMKSANPNLEVMCVGDDWQSIYRFGGSDISIMRAASTPKMNRKRVDLAETYRLPQEIADLSRKFVLKNPLQLEKTVTSKSDLEVPGKVVIHWDTEQQENLENLKKVISRIGSPANDPSRSLRVLARYTDNLPDKRILSSLWEGPVEVSTVHAAKGLEADYVIVMDMVQDFRGFPSTIEDDPVMALVMPEKELHQYGEERRLFYVALTRARRECHLISPLSSPSLFTLELLEAHLGDHVGLENNQNRSCPVCKSGQILVSPKGNGSYCSNIPLCDFSPPECPACGKSMIIHDNDSLRFICPTHSNIRLKSCPACDWGVLILKTYRNKGSGKESTFYSCHTWARTRCVGKSSKAKAGRS
ncbi:MAG: UvrD-helicase domain-containing protein [Candidatus Nanopelagicaceae bacterium]|nr:UvrD-helicase domain-containing protein [Candidatus Nanopelagicaceae bacterium]